MSFELDPENIPTWYFEKALNEIYPGTQIFVRDCNLSPEQLSKYEVGKVIREPRFVDSTHRVMGMATTHRFAIISNHMADMSSLIEDEEKKAWGLCMAQRNSRFKVLDIYEYDGKTQILLFHLPNDERWRLCENMHSNVDEDLIATSRERFENKCNAEIIPELASEEWLNRCSCPIGLDDNGNPFDLDIPFEERFRPLAEMGFREISESVIYLKDSKEVLDKITATGDAGFPDCVAFGYIDREAGLTLSVLGLARTVNGQTEYLHDLGRTAYILRYGGIADLQAAQVVDSALSEFSEEIDSIWNGYGMNDEQLTELRGIRMLDKFRHPDYPDDVQALLFKEGIKGSEAVWLRTCAIEEETILAKLLNEPNRDYGVHEGDILPIGFAEDEDGLVCVAVPEVRELKRDDETIDATGPHNQPYITCSRKGAPTLTSDEYQSGHDEEIAQCFGAIIRAESPIEKTWLCNRVRETFGIGRSGSQVQARSEAILKMVPHKETQWNGKMFIWDNEVDPDAYTVYRTNSERDSDRIAFQEIANAILDTLVGTLPVDKEELVRNLAERFGYKRVASRIRETFGKAIDDMVELGLLSLDEDGIVRASSSGEFVFAAGVDLAAGDQVTEGFYFGDPETAIASVSLEKLLDVIFFYVAAQEENPVGFFLELPCTAEEEDQLREEDEGPLHYGVYYSAALDGRAAIGLTQRYKDILLNSGLIAFGFACNGTQSQIYVDKYKVVTIYGLEESLVKRIFDLAGVPQGKPVTAWDTLSESAPGQTSLVKVEGKTIYDYLPFLKEDLGLELDRYEAEVDDAIRMDPCQPSPVEGASPIMVETLGGTVAIPDAYRQLPKKPEDPEWITGFALHTNTADIFVGVGVPAEIEFGYESIESTINLLREKLPEGLAIVEVDSGETSAGRKYTYAITKQLREPSGVQYDLIYQAEGDSDPIGVHGFFNEVGTTGVRDTMVMEMRAQELGGMQKAMQGWMSDPYDSNLTDGFLMNRSEEREYDAVFPAHPLSEARRLAAFLIEHDNMHTIPDVIKIDDSENVFSALCWGIDIAEKAEKRKRE